MAELNWNGWPNWPEYALVVKQGYDVNSDGTMVLKDVVVNWGDDAHIWYIIGGADGVLPSMGASGPEYPILTTGHKMEINDSIMIPTPGVYDIYVLCTFIVKNVSRSEPEKEITIKSNMYEVNILPKLGIRYESILRHEEISVKEAVEKQ